MNGGPNQHYIPKFLLRSFGILKRRVEIWCFGADEPPVRRRIKRTGSDDYFYSRPAADRRPTLDDTISAIEPQLSQTLREVCSKSPESPVDPIEAAAIVSHMLGRTAHVRSTFQDGLTQLLERFEALFAEPINVKKMVGLDSDAPTRRFRDMVAGELARNSGISGLGIPPRLLERVAFVILKEASTDLLGRGQELVSTTLKEIRSQLGELVRDAHNKGLHQAANSNERETLLRTFGWTVESAPESGAILPDCVVIAFGVDGNASIPLLVGGEELRAVVMAVSPERLLVGCKPGFELPADFEYNRDAARLSHSFFLSPRNDAETSCLHAMIGKRFTPQLEATIEGAFEGVLPEEHSGGPKQTDRNSVPFEWRPTAWDSYQFSVTASGDEAASERIQKELMALVANVANRLPLQRLDGITVGSDYPALLRGVDRGFEGGAAVSTVPAEIGVGLAQTVTVKRSGVIKGRVVMSGAVYAALISDNPKAADWAADIVVKQLARVALIGIVDETLPGRLLSPVVGEMDGWLYANVDGVPETYVASRIAGPDSATVENPVTSCEPRLWLVSIGLGPSLPRSDARTTSTVTSGSSLASCYRLFATCWSSLRICSGIAHRALRRLSTLAAGWRRLSTGWDSPSGSRNMSAISSASIGGWADGDRSTSSLPLTYMSNGCFGQLECSRGKTPTV